MAEDKNIILSEMLRTGIYGETWKKVAYLIVIIKNEDGSVIFDKYYDSSDHEGHAEMKMLKDKEFNERVRVNTDSGDSAESGESDDSSISGVDIILTINYSPCWECAPKLIGFYTENESLIQSFTIRFAHPYKTRTSIKPNEDCLKDLHKAGIKLEAMTEKSWFDVVMRFMFNLNPDRVRKRDEKTRNKLEELLHEDPVAGLTQSTKFMSLENEPKKGAASSRSMQAEK